MGNGSGWKMVVDGSGDECWVRRAGDVVATVRLATLNGSSMWFYDVGVEDHRTTGCRDTERSAKIKATKVLRWYAVRQQDFKRTAVNLRATWDSQGIKEVDPARGSAWDERVDCAVVLHIKWTWKSEEGLWESGAWRLWHRRSTGWMLQYPDGYVQNVHANVRENAMLESAFWIARALGERWATTW